MNDQHTTFHHQVAQDMLAHYGTVEQPPAGWRETLAWHWEQAHAYAEATETALEVAETHAARLDFAAARRWAERALALLERLDPAVRRIYELRTFALTLAVLEFAGQYREGLDYASRMLRLAQEHANREAEARALLASGRLQRSLGQFAEAEEALIQARALAARQALDDLEAEVRFHLAKVHQLQGRHLEALQELQLAREEHEARDDRARLAQVFTGVGDIYRVLGAYHEALGFYTRALAIEQGAANKRGQAMLKDKIALALLDRGKLDEALKAEQESLQLREEIEDIVGQARSYSVLGMIVGRLGQHAEAIDYHQQARALDEQTQNPRGQAVALLHIGDEARALGQYTLARDNYLQALVLARRAGDSLGRARTLERLGDVFSHEGDQERACGQWREALKIRETLGHADEVVALRDRLQRAGCEAERLEA